MGRCTHMVSIGVAAAELGVSTATLRKWESRYGLALSTRSAAGERRYSHQNLCWLRLAKRQLDAGARPAAVFGAHARQAAEATEAAQATEAAPTKQAAQAAGSVPVSQACPAAADAVGIPSTIASALTLLRSHRLDDCHALLLQARRHHGLATFVDQVAGPLASAVGSAWANGTLQVFEEHGFTQVLRSVLDGGQFLVNVPGAYPTVLLATLAGECHTLGLSMLHSVLHEAGARCVNLGAGLPTPDLVAAAHAFGAQVLALSLSTNLSPRVAFRQLTTLRKTLPAHVALWVGGAGVGLLARLPPGVALFNCCTQARSSLQAQWPRPTAVVH